MIDNNMIDNSMIQSFNPNNFIEKTYFKIINYDNILYIYLPNNYLNDYKF